MVFTLDLSLKGSNHVESDWRLVHTVGVGLAITDLIRHKIHPHPL
jgi:hypothetical protein